MMGLKDQLQSDLDVFFALNEFSAIHVINGRELNIIVDNDRLMQRSKKEFDGISVGELLYYVRASDYGDRPMPGTPQVFDGRQMYVFDCRDDNGVYEIILQQNRGG